MGGRVGARAGAALQTKTFLRALTRRALIANAGASPAVRCREDARESIRETESPKEQPPPESLRHHGPRAPDSLESAPAFG